MRSIQSLDSAAKAAAVMARFQTPHAFCEPLLQAALARQYPDLALTTQGHELVRMVREEGRLIPRQMTLLEAAMHNFTAQEAEAGGIEAGSLILPLGELQYGVAPGAAHLTDTQYRYAAAQQVALAPEAFASFCRELDLGRQYVEHFQAVFQPLSTRHPSRDRQQSDVAAALMFNLSDAVEVLADEALIKGHLTPAAHRRVLQTFLAAQWADEPVHCCQLRLLATSLREGYNLSGMVLVERSAGLGECVVYMPGEPHHPLCRYDSVQHFADTLREKLRDRAYQDYFKRFVAADLQAAFLERLEATLNPQPFTLPLQYSRPATPDPDADIGLRHYPVDGTLRWFLYEQQIVRMGEGARALVVPSGDMDRAAREARIQRYLDKGMSLLDAAAFFVPGLGEVMAAVGLVQVVKEVCVGVDDWEHGQTREALEHFYGVMENALLVAGSVAAGVALQRSPFVENLIPVTDTAGRRRLWNAQWSPYRSAVQLPDTLQPNALGQYVQDGRYYLRIDRHLYEHRFDLAAQRWQLVHPRGEQAYAPWLSHDGAGSWRHEHELPVRWSGAELMRRFGHPTQGLDDAALERIRTLSDVSEDRLREFLAQGQPLPASLRDALDRHRAQRQVAALGDEPQRSLNQRQQQVDQTWRQHQPALDGAAAPLLRDFASLTPRMANELAAQADALEHATLVTTSRVPLRLAQAARVHVARLRLTRACEGLHSPLLATADTDAVALGMLERLPGWTGDVHLELREHPRARLASAGEARAAQFKYVVRREGRYQAFDARDQQLSAEQGLFAALLAALPDSERVALRLNIHDSERLRTHVLQQALADRKQVARVLGQQPLQPWVRVPLREANGLGYPLSGRGVVPGRSANVQRLLNQLYPQLTLEQAEVFLQGLGASDQALEAELMRRQTEWARLGEQLDAWQASAYDSPRLIVSRSLAQREIRRCWQRQTARVVSGDGGDIGFVLDLQGLQVGEWPALEADFSHVGELNLNRGNLDVMPVAFLRSFTRLRRLRMNTNRLAFIPSNIRSLANLTRLDLGDNRIVLDTAAMQRLARLTRLRILRLDNNPLGLLPDVSRMNDLRGLYLRGTGARTWPPGVLACDHLESLDLRDNQIMVLPEGVLNPSPERADAVTAINRVTVLAGNPLNQRSLALISAYRLETQVNFGLRRTLFPVAPQAPGLAPAARGAPVWLQKVAAARRAGLTQTWEAVRAEPGGDAFFTLLDEMAGTDDFHKAYDDLRERVWSVVNAAHGDLQLREQLFYTAAHTRTCIDGVALVFSNVEVQVLVHQAMAIGNTQLAQSRLLQLARGLFRLDQVEAMALADIAARSAEVDEVEVRLAYRQGLAERLDLPAQPRNIRFAQLAAVSEARLKQAAAAIQHLDDSPQMIESMVSREFWVEHLKRRYADRFEQLNAGYFKLDEALRADAQHISEASYLGRTRRMQERRGTEERRLLEELTREALAGEVQETEL